MAQVVQEDEGTVQTVMMVAQVLGEDEGTVQTVVMVAQVLGDDEEMVVEGNGGRGCGIRIGAPGRGNGGRGNGASARTRDVPPLQFGNGSPALQTVETLFGQEERRLQPLLHPQRLNGGIWFGRDVGSRRVIVASIRRHFNGPWYSMRDVPNDTLIQWWCDFVKAFN